MGFALQTRLAASFGVCREFEGSVVSPTDSLRLSHVVSQHAGGRFPPRPEAEGEKESEERSFTPTFKHLPRSIVADLESGMT